MGKMLIPHLFLHDKQGLIIVVLQRKVLIYFFNILLPEFDQTFSFLMLYM